MRDRRFRFRKPSQKETESYVLDTLFRLGVEARYQHGVVTLLCEEHPHTVILILEGGYTVSHTDGDGVLVLEGGYNLPKELYKVRRHYRSAVLRARTAVGLIDFKPRAEIVVDR